MHSRKNSIEVRHEFQSLFFERFFQFSKRVADPKLIISVVAIINGFKIPHEEYETIFRGMSLEIFTNAFSKKDKPLVKICRIIFWPFQKLTSEVI